MTKEQAIEKLNKIITTKFNNDYSIDNVDKEAIEIILSMLEEKDREIDLMAEQLTTPIHDKKWVKEYFENKAKDVE